MPAPAWERIDDFLELDTQAGFATTGVLTFQSGGTRSIKGIFDYPMVQTHAGEYEQDTNRPTFLVKESDTSGIKRRDTIVLYGVNYELTANPLTDGTGLSTLKLAKVP